VDSDEAVVNHFEHEVLRRLREIEKLLIYPRLTLYQVGDAMALGSITPGSTGQFALSINFPAGVTPPSGYDPTIQFSSSDPSITFAPATTDLTNGSVPLSQQVVATVPLTDTAVTAQIAATALGTDGVTVLTSNVVTIAIPQAPPPPPPPPTEPTLVLSQVG
jgi:hypothetical protein